MGDHTVKACDQELAALARHIAEMGGIAEKISSGHRQRAPLAALDLAPLVIPPRARQTCP